MIRRIGTALAFISLFLLASPVRAEDDEPEFKDVVKEACKTFKATYKKLPEDEVISAIDELMKLYKKGDEEVDAKPRKMIINHLGLVLRLRVDGPIVKALEVLGQTDANALPHLDRLLKKAIKSKPPKTELYEATFEALGKLADRRSIKTLTGYLKYKEYDVIARTAEALEGYTGSLGRTRKEIFEELLKISEGVYSAANANANSEPAKKWRIIGSSVTDAMKALSRQEDLKDPTQFRRWFNNNKKKNWDKLDENNK